MAHFAELDENNVVLQVLVVDNADIQDLPFPESEPVGVAFLDGILPGRRWAQVSYNGNFRMRYCGAGDIFYPTSTATPHGAFGNAKPFDNWVFDDAQCLWIPPVPYPTDGKFYFWDQEQNMWLLSPYQPPVPPTIIGE